MGKAKTTRSARLDSQLDNLKRSVSRISTIACVGQVMQTQPSSVNSTQVSSVNTTQVKKTIDKKKIIEEFLKEEKLHELAFTRMLEGDIDAYKTACSMLKFSIASNVLNKPLKEFSLYRQMFSADIFDEEPEINNNNENDVENSAGGITSDANPSLTFNSPTVEISAGDCASNANPSLTFNVPTVLHSKRQTRGKSKFTTPLNKMETPSAITPKINVNQPISVLRHARLGERIISMTGSPILASSVPRDDTATVSVPFQDGRVFTIVPSDKFQKEQMPSLDIETKSQLQTLYKNLAKIVAESKD